MKNLKINKKLKVETKFGNYPKELRENLDNKKLPLSKMKDIFSFPKI